MPYACPLPGDINEPKRAEELLFCPEFWGSDLGESRRPSAEGCILRAENYMAGRDP